MTESRRILIVDDDAHIREVVSLALADEGYEVLVAPHGAAALQLTATYSPALILLDMRMPVMDGLDFCRAYREAPGPHAPIVILTAGRDVDEDIAASGADHVLSKPFNLNDLLAVVGRFVPCVA